MENWIVATNNRLNAYRWVSNFGEWHGTSGLRVVYFSSLIMSYLFPVQILTSTVGNVTSYCYQSVKNVVRTVFNVTVDALLVFSLLVVCYSLATLTAAIES